MAILIPVMATALVGVAVGALPALVWDRPLTRGAAWGTRGGALVGAVAVALLALSPS